MKFMQLMFAAALALASCLSSAPADARGCRGDYYLNVSGRCVHRPIYSPQRHLSGASAHCRDGSESFSQHHSGTCSHHGGVARWE